MSTNRFPYPLPCYPDYLNAPKSVDDLMPAAREALKRTTGRAALGLAQPGDKVLIVAPPPPVQDLMVLQAFLEAFKEKGISAQSVFEPETGTWPPPEEMKSLSAEDGWKEIFWRDANTAMLPPEIQLQRPRHVETIGTRKPLKSFLQKHKEYNAVFAGQGGANHWRAILEEEKHRFKDNWFYRTHEDLLGKWSGFPSEVTRLIEKKTTELLPQVEEVHVTDPEGTDVWWSISEETAKLWYGNGMFLSGHIIMHPYFTPGMRTMRGIGQDPFIFSRAQGVIAGTSNHFGFYPHMRSYLENGVIVRIEGGGLFGDLLRFIRAKTKDVQYPFHPEPGYFYLIEMALGTSTKSFRRRVSLFDSYSWFPNMSERNRSGVFHWGIGAESYHPEVTKFAKEHNLAHEHGGHAAHTYFNTYSIKLRKTGEWRKLIDKGRLTALDDPEVRSLASHYGEPDELLKEDWIPAIPGINYPGDYMRDYGNDPASWIRKDLEGRLPSTIGVPK